jgi:hypothetical protein
MAVKVAANFALEANSAESQGLDLFIRPSPKIFPPVNFLTQFSNRTSGSGGNRGGGGGRGGGNGVGKPFDRLGAMSRIVVVATWSKVSQLAKFLAATWPEPVPFGFSLAASSARKSPGSTRHTAKSGWPDQHSVASPKSGTVTASGDNDLKQFFRDLPPPP